MSGQIETKPSHRRVQWRALGPRTDTCVVSRPAPPVLTIRHNGSQQSFAPGHEVVVGRDLYADLRIADPRISRAHLILRFDFDQGRWMAIDNGSLNGTYVNGYRMPVTDIHDGQSINVGKSAGAPVDLPVRVPAADRPAIPDESDAGLRAAHTGLVDEPGAGGPRSGPRHPDKPGTRPRALLAGAPAPHRHHPSHRDRRVRVPTSTRWRRRCRRDRRHGHRHQHSHCPSRHRKSGPSSTPARPRRTRRQQASSPSSTPSPATCRTSRRDL